MREARNTSGTGAGTMTFIAQVRSSRPLEPNLRPAMNTTLSIRGRRSISPRSSKSQAMHSTPPPSRFSRSPGSGKRATPTTPLPDAEDENIACKPVQLGAEFGRGCGHDVFELGDVGNAFRKFQDKSSLPENAMRQY